MSLAAIAFAWALANLRSAPSTAADQAGLGERIAAAAQAEPTGTSPEAVPPAIERPPIVLLVGGMTGDLKSKDIDSIWGERRVDGGRTTWNGMIGALDSRGYRYGGMVRPRGMKIVLPECLDTAGASCAPESAELFALEYSASAREDGLTAKVVELVECIKELKRTTGRNKVAIVAHSAGGVVARAYVQEALAGFKYHHDVSHLVTIATPHLGSALATHFGDLLGTRATALKPNSAFLRELNVKLDLPTDVRFASLVIKGMGADAKGDGETYDPLLDETFLNRLPSDYHQGGDQIVHAKSQNLALVPCGRRYEAATKRPIQFAALRVPDPTPGDRSPREMSVHVAAPRDQAVVMAVEVLLRSDGLFDGWNEEAVADEAFTHASMRKIHSHFCAMTLIEQSTAEKHFASQVTDISVDGDRSRMTVDDFTRCTYEFEGTARTRGAVFRVSKHETRVTGRLSLNFDRFGRPFDATHRIHRVADVGD
jgi:hypothetical protein